MDAKVEVLRGMIEHLQQDSRPAARREVLAAMVDVMDDLEMRISRLERSQPPTDAVGTQRL
jgi:hypothetical protein